MNDTLSDGTQLVNRFMPISSTRMQSSKQVNDLRVRVSNQASVQLKKLGGPDQKGNLVIRNVYLSEAIFAAALADEIDRNDMVLWDWVETLSAGEFFHLTACLREVPDFASRIASLISATNQPFVCRLLVKISGTLHLNECCEPICRRVLNDGQRLQYRTRQRIGIMRPFYEVAKETLRRLVPDSRDLIDQYRMQSKQRQKWQAKQVFEYALRLTDDTCAL